VAIAGAAFVVEVIGLPACLIYIIHRNKSTLDDKKLKISIGTLYCTYKPNRYLWDAMTILRRLLIASFAALVPFDNPLLVMGLFVVILTYYVCLSTFKPYKRKTDYALDSLSQCVLLITLFGGLLVDKYYPLSIVVVTLNFVFMMMSLFVIFPLYRRRLVVMWRQRRSVALDPPEHLPEESMRLINP